MALFRPYVQEVVLDTGAAANFGQTITYPIRQRGFWLEAIILNVMARANGTPGTKTPDYLRALVKRIALRADERTDGLRTIVDVSGPALIDFNREIYGFDQPVNVYSQLDTAVGSNHNISYVIPFRHPLMPEPHAYRTCLPLPRYGSDPVLEVTLAGSATEISSTFALHPTQPGIAVNAVFVYREVIDPDNSFPHWKSEILTKELTWPGTGNQAIEDLSQVGLLTAVHQQDFVGANKSFVVSNPMRDMYSLEYRTRNVIKGTPYGLRMLSGNSQVEISGGYNPSATIFYDLLSELTRSDVYHFGSTLDLSLNALRGGKLRLLAENVQANARSRITTHKILADPAKVLSGTL